MANTVECHNTESKRKHLFASTLLPRSRRKSALVFSGQVGRGAMPGAPRARRFASVRVAPPASGTNGQKSLRGLSFYAARATTSCVRCMGS